VVRRGTSTALDGVHLHVHAGELVVVFGGSGAGKTALLRAIAGVDQVDAGTVRIAGVDVDGRSPRERRVALVSGATASRITEVIREHSPEVLLIDVPATPAELRSIRDATGITMIVASSDPRSLGVADRVAVVRAGEVVQIGVPRDIVDDPVDVEVARLTGELDVAAATVERDGPGGWLVADGWRERVWRPSVLARAGAQVLVGRRRDRFLVFDAVTGRQLR
jgi:ABC-type Fe3+/spermidine/putrescine transport system ATPase subunit